MTLPRLQVWRACARLVSWCVVFFTICVIAQPGEAQTPAVLGGWSSAGTLSASRTGAAAATLLDGRVFITGGIANGQPQATAEIYDGTSFKAVASMNHARSAHTAATLKDGRVVVVGGYSEGNQPTASIEIYDPKTNTWTEVANSLNQARAGHTMTAMQDGRFLIAGGNGSSGPLATLEIFDPTANACTLMAATMSSPRAGHAAALLPNGAILFAGGFDGNNVLSSVDAYDPTSNTMATPLQMSVARRDLTATALLNGQVLLAGGNDGKNDLATLEIVDLSTGKISPAGSLSTPRSGHAAIVLPNSGSVLIAGGTSNGSPVASAEVYSPVTSVVTPAGSMSVAREGAVAAMFAAAGQQHVLVAGGEAGSGASTGDAYTFATLQTDKPDYAPNTPVTVTGKGWAPGESVTLVFHEQRTGDADVSVTATADATGSFQITAFKPDIHDEKVTFVLTGQGAQSGATAQTVFNDSTYGTTFVNLYPSGGAVGTYITASATLEYLYPEYQTQYYNYSCNCGYNCGCGWFGCDYCCDTCTGVNYVFVGYAYDPLYGAQVQFSFNNGTSVAATTDGSGYATANLVVPPGATSLSVSYGGSPDGTYGASGSSVAFTASAGPTFLSFQSIGSITYGQATTSVSAHLSSQSTSVPNQQVAFYIDSKQVGSATTDSGGTATAQIATSSFGVGTHQISAVFSGNSSYTASSAQGQISIQQRPLTITPLPISKIYGQALTLSTTSAVTTSGLVNGDTVSSVWIASTGAAASANAGTYALIPSEAAGSGITNYAITYNPGVLTVTPAAKSITFPALNTPVSVNSTATLGATASNGDPVTYSITGGVASLSGSTITFTNAGTVTIEADSAATGNYYAATPVSQTITVNPAPKSYVAPTTAVKSTSAAQTATVNFTTAGTLGTIAVVTQGAAGKDFNVAAGGTCAVGTEYTASQACTVNYTFTPLSPGAREGAVVLTDASGSMLGSSYLGGTGTGPLGLFTTDTQTLGISGLSTVRGISLDGYGNIYGFETTTGAVDKFAAGTGAKTQLALLPASSAGGATAVDGAGNLFVTDSAAGALYEFVGSTGAPVKVASIPAGDDNLEIDGAGNLYYSGYGNSPMGAIYEISAGTYQVTNLVPGGIGHRFVGMAVDAAGNIFAGDFSNNILYELPAGATGANSLVTLASGGYLSNPHGVAVDPAGNIYVSNYNGSTVIRYAAGTYAATLLPAAGQRGIALDGAGNLYTITSDATIAVYTRTQATPFTFANTVVGTTRDSQQGVVFENDGNADLVISGYSADAPFALNGSQNKCSVGTLSSGASCVVGATFSPVTVTTSTGTATITDNTLGVAGTPQTIALSGTSTQQTPAIAVVPATISYSSTPTTLTAAVNFVGSTVPTGAVSISVDGGAGVATTCSGTTSPLSCTANYPTGALAVPTHTITASIAADTNFTTASGTATLTVNPIAPTISFTVANHTYGNAPFALAATSNSTAAITYSVVSGPGSISGNTLTITGAGPVTVEASQAANGNYTAGTQNASFTVAQAQLGVAIQGTPTKTYDATTAAALTSANFAVTGLVGADNITIHQTVGTYASANAGAETVTATLGSANYVAASGLLSNYVLPSSATGAGLINQALASVTPNAATKVYGAADPALTGTLAGFVASDNVTATYARTAGETVLGGPYTISASLAPTAVLSNYKITYNTAQLTITPAPTSVTPNLATKVYGTADPALTGTLAGFVASDNVTATYARTAGETVLGGPYTISASLAPTAVLSNYTITYNTAQFTITPAPASVTPNAATKVYGTADPALTGTLAGFVGSDNVTATYARSAGETVLGGPYTISATLTPAAVLSNYRITYNTAQLTITPAPASVTPTTATKVYGAADPAFTGTVVGFLSADNVTATYARNAGETVLGGPYTISATLTPTAVLSNYTITYNTAPFTITAAPASVTPNSATKVYGTADPVFTGTMVGFLPADHVVATYTRNAGENVLGGPYTISATLAPTAVLSNYNITYNTAQFTITPAPASFTFGSLTQTYTSGPLAPTVTTNPAGVSFSVTGAPDIAAGSYTVTATVTNPNYVGSGSTPFTILQAPATIALSNLSQVYSGSPLAAMATVTPAYCGPAAVTYDGSVTAPSNIGTYAVVAAMVNPNCTASNASGTLIVNAFAASSCVYALNPAARSAFSVSDGSTLDAQCSIQVNSTARDAFDVDGHKTTVDATAISVVGGASVDKSATVSHAPATGQTAAADPLAAVVAPTVGACTFTSDHDWDGDDDHGKGTKTIALNPGTYCGGINIDGKTTVTFNPGTYILLGGGLNIDGGAQVTGAGVTFYNTGDREHRYQPIHIDGGSKTTLSAPLSGPLAGVLFFQDRNIAQNSDHDHDDDNRAQPNVISGNTESSFAGALYFPTTPLIYSGRSEQDPAVYTLIVADTVSVAGNSNLSLTVLGTPMSDTDSDACSPGPGKNCDHDHDGDHK